MYIIRFQYWYMKKYCKISKIMTKVHEPEKSENLSEGAARVRKSRRVLRTIFQFPTTKGLDKGQHFHVPTPQIQYVMQAANRQPGLRLRASVSWMCSLALLSENLNHFKKNWKFQIFIKNWESCETFEAAQRFAFFFTILMIIWVNETLYNFSKL